MPKNNTSPTTNPAAPPNRNMMYCRSCGAQIAKKAKICPHCGAKNSKPFYKKWWFWLLITLVLITVFGSGESEPSAPSSTQPSSPTPSPSSNAPESTSQPESSSNVFVSGDVVETEHFRITYQECDPDWKGYSRYSEPQSGNKIVRAFFVFENISNTDRSCGSIDFSCYADGLSCSQYYWSSDDALTYTSLSPGRKLQGYIAFEVPIGAEEIELEYDESFDFFSSQKLIFIIK